ncbi:MAG: DUF6691 family protein [Candidatus Binataceae bacterium]
MNQIVIAFVSGFVFAVGLVIGGMTQPAKVVGFLDFAGNWDASLALVMIGAIAVYAPMARLAGRLRRPLLAESYSLPARREIDGRLIAGAALFGIGWGLGGFCPGPAIASIATGHPPVLLFVAAMIAGICLYNLAQRWIAGAASPAHRDAGISAAAGGIDA